MDQRSGDGYFSGRFKILVIHSGSYAFFLILKYWTQELLHPRPRSSRTPTSRRRIRLEEQKAQKQDRFLRGRQIACLIYDHFRVTGANDSVENYADLFTIGLRNDDIQEFDSKWDGILLSMTKIPSDDILEELYKLRIRVSEKLRTVSELYNLEIHQKKLGPDYHRLKTMVKRSIEQDLRTRNFEARNGKIESRMLVKNQRENSVTFSKDKVIDGSGKPQGCVRKETITVSSTMQISVPNQRLSPLLLQNIVNHKM